MISCICRCSNHWSALHRSEPIGDSFTLRWNNPVTCLPHQRNIWRSSARSGHPKAVAVESIGRINAIGQSSTLQIPIGM